MMPFPEGTRRSSLTLASSTRDDVSDANLSRSSPSVYIRSVSTRHLTIITAFVIGFTITVIMKREHLLWLAASTAGASSLLQFGQGGTFDYPGLRFGADKKFSITVFSDLHLGERMLHIDRAIQY